MEDSNGGTLIIDNQGTTYYSLTNIARKHSTDSPSYVIQSWLRNYNTLEFLRIWEEENNPEFRSSDYQELLKRVRENNLTITAKQWIENTGAAGVVSKQGRYGGTYAHPVIACEFLAWLSPKFKYLMIQTFQLSNEINQRELMDTERIQQI